MPLITTVDKSSSVVKVNFTVKFSVTLLAILLGGTATAARAQSRQLDEIVLQRSNEGGRITMKGAVLDYAASALRFRASGSGALRVYPSWQVVAVRTAQTKAHINGLLSLSQDKIPAAKSAFEQALKDENRAWVRRDILALLVRCALLQGDYESAGSHFELLYQSDPKTRHFKLIPLIWSPQAPQAGLKAAARVWLTESSPAARLMAASVLLRDRRFSNKAHRALEELAVDANERVRLLARAQLWRRRLLANDLSAGEVFRWQKRTEAMPEDLRGGPYYVVARGYWQRGDYERAAAAFLWLPLIYADDHYLAARACLEAADALAHLGQRDAAATLYLEVTQRFRQTPFAQEASGILNSPSPENRGTFKTPPSSASDAEASNHGTQQPDRTHAAGNSTRPGRQTSVQSAAGVLRESGRPFEPVQYRQTLPASAQIDLLLNTTTSGTSWRMRLCPLAVG